MPDPLSKAKTALDLDEIDKHMALLDTVNADRKRRGVPLATHARIAIADVRSLVARARRADELEKRVAELEARVEYLS